MVDDPLHEGAQRHTRLSRMEAFIGVGGTAFLFAVFAAPPLLVPAMAGAAWLRDTAVCAVMGECEALADRR